MYSLKSLDFEETQNNLNKNMDFENIQKDFSFGRGNSILR